MPDSPDAVSSPTDSAGEGDALTKALSAAAETLDLSEDNDFSQGLMEPKRESKKTDQPVDETDKPSTEAKPDAKPAQAKDAKPDTVTAPTDLAPPANWDAKRKDAFAKLPTPEAKQVMLDLAKGFEVDFNKKSTELANKARYAESIDALVTEEHRRQMAAGGFKNVVEGVGHLIKLNDWAMRDTPSYLRWAVDQYGKGDSTAALRQIFPEAFTGTGQVPPNTQQPPAHIQTQVYDDSEVRSQLNGIAQIIADQQEATADDAVERFRKSVDDTGQPKYPHLPKVETRMVALLSTPELRRIRDMGTRLQHAYDTAIAQDPAIRAEIIETEAEKRAAAKVAERMRAADLEKAKRARSPIRSSPVPGAAKAQPRGLDEAARMAGDLLGI